MKATVLTVYPWAVNHLPEQAIGGARRVSAEGRRKEKKSLSVSGHRLAREWDIASILRVSPWDATDRHQLGIATPKECRRKKLCACTLAMKARCARSLACDLSADELAATLRLTPLVKDQGSGMVHETNLAQGNR